MVDLGPCLKHIPNNSSYGDAFVTQAANCKVVSCPSATDPFLIHCYLFCIHNTCSDMLAICRKYCLPHMLWNGLSRCPLKNPKFGKNYSPSKRKTLRKNWTCQYSLTVSPPKISGLKTLKVPDAIICYLCCHYVLVFAGININFHLYINGI